MKFTFAFEKLLKHKHTLEDMAHRDWATAQRAVDEALKQIESYFVQIEEARTRNSRLELGGQASGPQLAQTDEFIKGQKLRIEFARVKARQLMTVAEEKHEALIEAAKERKTLERLRERRLEDYKLKRKKMELKSVDDMVTMRAHAKSDDDDESEIAAANSTDQTTTGQGAR